MQSEQGVLLLLCIIMALLLGALIRFLVQGTRVPYSVALLVIGLALGSLERFVISPDAWPQLDAAFGVLTHLDPHLILFIFLPTLIFESAYSLEPHLLKRVFTQVSLLAIPGLLISALLTAMLVRWLLPWEWSWPLAFLFGALISATDPVAVVALLREVSSRKRLETLIEGESLFNDGTAIVLFSLCFSLLVVSTDEPVSAGGILFQFLWTVLLGGALGYGLGRLAIFMIGRIYNDPMVETTLSIAAAYLVYFLAEEVFHASGVVAVVVVGILFSGRGRTYFSTEAIDFLHHFWSVLAHAANTLIFLIVGLLIADRIELFDLDSWWLLGVLYIGILLIRGLSILILSPLLKRQGVGLNPAKMAVLVWGGLRGAVALALALMVAQEPAIGSPWGEQVLFLTAGIVVLTILINGSTMSVLFRWLGIDRLPDSKLEMIRHAETQIREQMVKALPELRKRSLTQCVDWDALEAVAMAPLVDDESERPVKTQQVSTARLGVEFRRRILETERSNYGVQYREGYLGRAATSRLIEQVERVLDGEPCIHPRHELKKYWCAPRVIKRMRDLAILRPWATRIAYRHMVLGYDIARGFIHAQDEILAYLPSLAPSEEEEKRVRLELLHNKRATYIQLMQLKESFPELAMQVENHTAFKILLIHKKQMVKALEDKALLDKPEVERLLEALNDEIMALSRMPDTVPMPDPLRMIKMASWAQGLSDSALNHLVAAVEQRIYESGEVIYGQGRAAESLVIVARGAVEKVEYQQGEEVIRDVLGPGSLVGISAMWNETNPITLRAATPVDILWIPALVFKKLMEEDAQLVHFLAHQMDSVSSTQKQGSPPV